MSSFIRKSKSKGKKLLKSKAKVPIAIKQYVQRQIAVSEETKHQNFSSLTTLLTYTAATQTLRTLDLASCLGLITQGTGQGNRIGNKIKVKKLIVRGWLSVGNSFGTGGATPQCVKMMVGRLKQTFATPDGSYSALYQSGSSTAAPTNTYFDILRPIQRDQYIIYHQKVFKLATATNASGSNASNDFNMLVPFSINLNKHVNVLNYADGATPPINFACFIWFVSVNADGSATSAVIPPLVNCAYDMDVEYDDA